MIMSSHGQQVRTTDPFSAPPCRDRLPDIPNCISMAILANSAQLCLSLLLL